MSAEATADSRFCDWPRCPSSYPLFRGPATPGWCAFGVVRPRAVLCPFHAMTEHRPSFVLITPDANTVRPGCSCTWSGTLTAPRFAITDWQEHLVALDLQVH